MAFPSLKPARLPITQSTTTKIQLQRTANATFELSRCSRITSELNPISSKPQTILFRYHIRHFRIFAVSSTPANLQHFSEILRAGSTHSGDIRPKR